MAPVTQPLGPALVRTALPFALSGAGVLIAARLLAVDLSALAVVTLAVALGTVYYLLARLVETRLSPRAGALMLASTRTPTYPAPPQPPAPAGCGSDKDCVDHTD